MADKLSTRVVRSITFTCDTLEDKARYQAHAKKQGRTLAGLIKYLLEKDMQPVAPPPTPPA